MTETPFSVHEQQRRDLWAQAWVATANANDCKSPEVATKYADAALRDFDSRFPRPAGF